MELSHQQAEALDALAIWLPTDDPLFLLAGYAGTGKTTLGPEIAELVGWDVLFGAFTGIATLRLREKGCVDAETIHRLIYLPRMKCQARLRELKTKLRALVGNVAEGLGQPTTTGPQGPHADEIAALQRQVERERANLARPEFTLNVDSRVSDARLLIVDEASMIGRRMGEDLLSFGTKVVALGDPAQLPPVAEACYFKGREPNYLLTDIHRQAEGSEILQLAAFIRQGGVPAYTDGGDVRVLPKGVLTAEEVSQFDQVICGYNRSRRVLNATIRDYLGFDSGLPQPGDKLVCLKNDYEIGLFNGGQWWVEWIRDVSDDRMELAILPDLGDGKPYADEVEPIWVSAHRHWFEGRENELAPWDVREAACFDFGYAVTCHKAQGSEWEDVLVIDEPIPRSQPERWRYTAVTRAAKTLTMVR